MYHNAYYHMFTTCAYLYDTDAAHTCRQEIKSVIAHGLHELELSQVRGSCVSCQHHRTPGSI